jgi:hypothetical protein
MATWREAGRAALWSGSAAAVLSGVVLAVCGKLERDAPAGPLNGPSQWIWGERAAYRRRPTWRHTAVGYCIHHVVSIGWATLHEKHVAGLARGYSARLRLAAAGATAAFACGVDYRIAQGRMQPGFDKQLSRISLFLVYSAFALGLALRAPKLHEGSHLALQGTQEAVPRRLRQQRL